MQRISLKNLDVSKVDQLSREQLKNVLGGVGDVSPIAPNIECFCGGPTPACYIDPTSFPTVMDVIAACQACCD